MPRSALVAVAAVWLALACGTASPPLESPRPAATQGALAQTLAKLAGEALARGELDVAEDRYERWRARDPRATGALVGLGRVALARGETQEAEGHFRSALAVDSRTVDAWVGLADLASSPGDRRDHLERALDLDRHHTGAHARLARVTGRAPQRARSLEEAVRLASHHPYDPRALVDAGRYLADSDRRDEAAQLLESVLSLADVDPPSTELALDLLPTLSAGWAERRVVPVHVYADAKLRAEAGWRFRQRWLWAEMSNALDPVLHTRFVITSFGGLDPAGGGPSLPPVLSRLMQTTAATPSGLVAGFTARPRPRHGGAMRGIADYMGRHLVVRDVPGDPVEIVLAHEVLHIYGGIHVIDDVESLMNPTAESRRLDPLNAAIVTAMAPRAFGPGGVERNVLPRIALDDSCDAFARALGVNLTFRELGLDELLGGATQVGPGAWSQVQKVERLDEHLADVSRFVARLFWEAGRRVKAVGLLETSARLYGLDTPRGRTTYARAEALRRHLKATLGVR